MMTGPSSLSLLSVLRTFPVIRLYEATLLHIPTSMDLIRGLDSMTLRSPDTILVEVFLLTLRKPVGPIPAFRLLFVFDIVLRESTMSFVLPLTILMEFPRRIQRSLRLWVPRLHGLIRTGLAKCP